jgi:drug/metabolite transporter (DMT)-like permease
VTNEEVHERHGIARLELLATAVLFSTGGAAIKAASFDGWQVASLRSGIAFLAVLLLLREARTRWTRHAILVGAGYAATMILFVQSTKLTTAANAIFLQSTAPIYLVLLGPWLLGESNRKRDFIFLAVMGVGLLCFFVGTEPPVVTAPRPLEGNILALLSGLSWALTVAGLRYLGKSAPASGVQAVAAGNLIAFLFCLPFALPLASAGAKDWLVIVYLGVFQIGLAYFLLTRAIRSVRALDASLLLLIEPVLNPVWAWIVHGERPGAWALVGGAIILAASAVQARRD